MVEQNGGLEWEQNRGRKNYHNHPGGNMIKAFRSRDEYGKESKAGLQILNDQLDMQGCGEGRINDSSE